MLKLSPAHSHTIECPYAECQVFYIEHRYAECRWTFATIFVNTYQVTSIFFDHFLNANLIPLVKLDLCLPRVEGDVKHGRGDFEEEAENLRPMLLNCFPPHFAPVTRLRHQSWAIFDEIKRNKKK